MDQIMTTTKNLNQSQNKVIVSMDYDNIETNITLISGHGAILPDPSVVGSYNIIWWNASDYINPTDDPFVEVVSCITKISDTLIVMRSQQQTLASPKNIFGKLYNMTPLPYNNLEALSYYNLPQPHGASSHTGTIGDHTNLINKGTNTHVQIDTALTASAGHIAASGTSVHGLGTMSTQNSTSVSITAGTITGITDLTVADGGTGASDATTARTNLGLASGGTGDIWVEKTGDTMTSTLVIDPLTDVPALSIIPASDTATTKFMIQGRNAANNADKFTVDNAGNIVTVGTVDGVDVSTVPGLVTTHAGLTIAHGSSGNVVGQTTLDTHTNNTTTAHGATGAVVGTTNTQTVTNKTLKTVVGLQLPVGANMWVT